jgi:phage host-nuclease inhibitor protein Gam
MKKQQLINYTLSDAEAAFAEYSNAMYQLQHDSAEMEKKITALRAKYQERNEINDMAVRLNYAILSDFAEQHRDEYFKDKKSLELSHGTIGFRTGNPTLKSAKGFTLKACLALVKALSTGYVRVKEELDKAKLLADRNMDGMEELLKKCGLEIKQEETFYVEQNNK